MRVVAVPTNLRVSSLADDPSGVVWAVLGIAVDATVIYYRCAAGACGCLVEALVVVLRTTYPVRRAITASDPIVASIRQSCQ